MKVTIRGLTFEVPVYGDEATTRRYAEIVADRFAEAEASAEFLNTQVFALQTAIHFLAELEVLKAGHLKALNALRAAKDEALQEKDRELRALSDEVAGQIRTLSETLDELLDEFEGERPEPPPWTPPPDGRKGRPPLRVVKRNDGA